MNATAEGGVNKIFDNFYVREAMQEAMDTSAITKAVYNGYGAPQDGPIPEDPKTRFLDPQLTTPPYPYDPSKAKALLTANGWHEVDGVMTQGSEQMKFSLIYPSGDQAETETAELLQENWASIGVKVTLEALPFNTLVGELAQPTKWQLVTGIDILYGGNYPSGEDYFGGTGLDEYGWNNAEENKLIAQTIAPAPSPAVNMERFYAYEKYTADSLPMLWMPNQADLDEVAPNVGGFTLYTSDPVTGGDMPEYWWVK
jgi:peptide/nickel transport system substrate-binding protein